MDAANPRRAAEHYQEAGVTFLQGIDRADALFKELGFERIPSGMFVDEDGVVRYAKFGGFDAGDKATVQRLEDLLAGPRASGEPTKGAK